MAPCALGIQYCLFAGFEADWSRALDKSAHNDQLPSMKNSIPKRFRFSLITLSMALVLGSRALVNAALDGSLNAGSFEKDPIFGLDIPVACTGVPEEVLNPRNTWSDKAKYDETARKLVGMFKENFAKYAPHVTPEVASVL